MKHVAAYLLWFAALWWLWQLLSGEWNATEWVAGAGAAAVASALAELARSRTGANARLPLHLLRSVPSAFGMVFVDFALVVWALFRRRRGAFLTTKTEVAGSVHERVWATYLATLSANAYVLEIDRDSDTALTHHLVPFRRSQEPV